MSKKNKQNKIGRNDACFCGSGKKYKYCHVNNNQKTSSPDMSFISKKIEEHHMLEIQRKAQQGLGKPIITTIFEETRTVAVGNKLYQGKWKTFHEFLLQYIEDVMGIDWGNQELNKPYDERHPLLKMYHAVCLLQKETAKTPDEVHSALPTGAISAYIWLSYNLYLIAHNAELQTRLIGRLQHIEQFAGANYETYIAAIFIKAGFSLEFENENDRATTHCEFTATHLKTGKKYSVECKFRHRKNFIIPDGSADFKLGIRQPLNKALKKQALHKRVIFIDLDLPATEIKKYTEDDFVCELKKCENDPACKNAPPAYIFLTNNSYHYDLNVPGYTPMYFLEGFKIPDFKNKKINLHEAIQSRKNHLPIEELWASIKEHNNIPSTFDGSIPYFSQERLLIGRKYIVNDQNGKKQTVELQQAIVDEVTKKTMGLCKNTDGHILRIEFPMSDFQMDIYRQNKDTFFGVYKKQPKGIKNPLDIFDFCIEGLKSLSKDKLLVLLKEHPDYPTFFEKEQTELLEIYCEAYTNSWYKNNEQKNK